MTLSCKESLWHSSYSINMIKKKQQVNLHYNWNIYVQLPGFCFWKEQRNPQLQDKLCLESMCKSKLLVVFMEEQVLSGLTQVSTHLCRCASNESHNQANWSIILVQPLLHVFLFYTKRNSCLVKFNKTLAPFYASKNRRHISRRRISRFR